MPAPTLPTPPSPQFLESYKSVTLDSMAAAFDVGLPFLDAEISDFICAGRISAKIDKVGQTLAWTVVCVRVFGGRTGRAHGSEACLATSFVPDASAQSLRRCVWVGGGGLAFCLVRGWCMGGLVSASAQR